MSHVFGKTHPTSGLIYCFGNKRICFTERCAVLNLSGELLTTIWKRQQLCFFSVNCGWICIEEKWSRRRKKMVLYWLTWWIVIYILGIRQSIKSEVKQRGKFVRLPRTTAVISKMRRFKMIRLNAKVLQERGRICQLHRCNFTCYSEHVSCRRIAFKD